MLSEDHSAEFRRRFADRCADGAAVAMPQRGLGLAKPTVRLWRERTDRGGAGAIDGPRGNGRCPQGPQASRRRGLPSRRAFVSPMKGDLEKYIDWYNNVRIKRRLDGSGPVEYRLGRAA